MVSTLMILQLRSVGKEANIVTPLTNGSDVGFIHFDGDRTHEEIDGDDYSVPIVSTHQNSFSASKGTTLDKNPSSRLQIRVGGNVRWVFDTSPQSFDFAIQQWRGCSPEAHKAHHSRQL